MNARYILSCLAGIGILGFNTGCGDSIQRGAESPQDDAPVVQITPAPEGVDRAFFGDYFVNAQNEQVDAEALSGKRIGLYFSAIWCPPCRDFTPRLVDAYNTMRQQGQPFEVVFVSSDRNNEAMFQYMNEYDMAWLSVPFDDERRMAMAQHHQIRGIPSLVVVDERGQVISRQGVRDIRAHGANAIQHW